MSLLAAPFYHYENDNWKQVHWYKETLTEKMPNQQTLRVATFNVLCDLFKKLEPAIQSPVRYEYHFSTLLPSLHADALALQEVTVRYMEQLMSQSWVQEQYPYTTCHHEHTNTQKIFTIILSKIPMKELYMLHADMSSADRPMPVVVFENANGHEFTLSTMHLKAGKECNLVRKQQIECLFQLFGTLPRTMKCFAKIGQLKKQPVQYNKKTWRECENTLLVGDFNLHGEQEEEYFPSTATDVWKALHNDTSNTVDHITNRMVVTQAQAKGKIPHSNRYDRVYLLPQNKFGTKPPLLFTPQATELFGTHCLPDLPDVFPSDHFGIVTNFSFNA
jgi:endonuclease/exonuclease/phosphatase family metal-dependent hydrolase